MNGTDKEKYTLDYYKNGNIKSEIAYTNYDTAKTITKQYTYDEIGELKSVSNTDSSSNIIKNTSYTYDLVGNRLTMMQGNDLYEYNYNDFNQLLYEYKNKSSDPNPVTTITYDDNGNEKTDISKKDVDGNQKTYTTDYTFNSAGFLIAETVNDGSTTRSIKNSYDGTGNRIREYVSTTNNDGSTINAQPLEVKYFYLGKSLLFTADKDNQKGEENILDPNGQIAASKRFDGEYANNYFFYNYDFRGSVTNILDPSGKLVKGYDYDEFGNTKDSESTKNNNFKNDVKFTGAIEDQAAGLYYMNSRFYNPASGRFISQDTYSGSADEPWTQHLYNYTSNNPVNMVDPTGHIQTHPVAMDDGGYTFSTITQVTYNDHLYQQYSEVMTSKNPFQAVGRLGKYLYMETIGAYGEFCREMGSVSGMDEEWSDTLGYTAECLLTGTLCDSIFNIFKGDCKVVPNPYGKKGGPLHQGKIQEIADNLKRQGYDISFEKYVKTEGGFKSSRYGDILAIDPKTDEQFIIQVGKQTKAGDPISREKKAIQDLINAGWEVKFIPYN